MEVVLLFSLFVIVLSPQLEHVYANTSTNNNSLMNSISEKQSISVIEGIYQFGDSASDTGNLIREKPTCECAFKPYGQTLRSNPTGRCSDGLLLIDFIAQALKVPLLEQYLNKDGDFRHGVNFAVGGATSMNVSTIATKGDIIMVTNSSLLVQLGWFKSHLNTICTSTSLSECKRKLGKVLFVVGVVGANDYGMVREIGASMKYLHAMVPEVIQVIVNTVEELIYLGAKRIIVPGSIPLGCMPSFLTRYKKNDSTMYDEFNCLRSWNELTMLHNHRLQNAISKLQIRNRDVAIVYGDCYTPVMSIFKHPRSFGFEEDKMHKSCCGSADNEYNYDWNKLCGKVKVFVCKNPNKRPSWDGMHLTQHAYQLIAHSLLRYSLPMVINHPLSTAL